MRTLATCAMMAALWISASVSHAGTPSHFELRHGAGKLRVPTWNPLSLSAGTLRWSDGCGNSSRICATGTSGNQLFYILGGTLSPQDAKEKLHCEAQATASPSGDQCLVRMGATTTWTRKFDTVAVSISVDATDARNIANLERWFSQVSWEAGR